jgi:alpha-ribazole phosphatase
VSEQPQTTFIDLLRHGEVDGGNYYRGQIDDPLTSKGWQQMESAVATDKPWDVIVSSSLSRCQAFSSKLSEKYQLPLQVKDEFREIHFGQWQGKTSKELMETHARQLDAYWRDPESFTPPDAESVTDFRVRVSQAWQALLKELTGQHVLLVSHGGVMGMILSEVLAIPITHLLRMDIKYAAVIRIAVEHYQDEYSPRLIFHNGDF